MRAWATRTTHQSAGPQRLRCVACSYKRSPCLRGVACRALGVDEEMAHTSVRFGLGRYTTAEEVDLAVEQTAARVLQLRDMSPLWEMVQDGIDLKSIQWSQH